MRKIDWTNLSKDDLIYLLETNDESLIQTIYDKAYEVKVNTVGKNVYFRGIIEFSNICDKDCYYCGIRHSNKDVDRYFMDEEEILSSAKWAYDMSYGSLVLQSGERTDDFFVDKVEDLLKKIMKTCNNDMGITLSLGEQSFETFKKWREAGANRYLLRIETSNKNLYKTMHPNTHDWEERLRCLKYLKDNDYQVGTGVLIGVPGQTAEDLANDIIFFKENDIDMIGMGPFIPHPDTPFKTEIEGFDKQKQVTLALKMIALTRLYLKDVNIAATTALQALDPLGRECGLKAGANIIMPVITDIKYRKQYLLYKDKPCLDENASQCRSCLEKRIESVGETVVYGKKGDSPHYTKRKSKDA